MTTPRGAVTQAFYPDLYPKSRTGTLDFGLFRQPTAEYRGAPFWAWNTRLEKKRLLRQIEVMRRMGMGGFHMHARTGLGSEYLGEAFMEMVGACVERARSLGMLAWLYDEDRYPSGFAGGRATDEPRFRAKHLLWTLTPREGHLALLARHHVALEGGRLAEWRRLGQGEPAPAGVVWHAYLETQPESAWYNGRAYLDTLSGEAVERFVALTHERYARAVGREFGHVVPGIFTDEPQFARKGHFGLADEERDLEIPWTTDLPESYQAAYGEDILDCLPELFWERLDRLPSASRYRYHDHLAERFAVAFADTVGGWCDRHGLLLTGHLMDEPTLASQTAALGEAMRSYRGFSLPGVDVLCDWREHNTVKQAASAARQYGRPGVLGELYGVTGWDFDFAGHKAQGDWQAALGVTVRVHHHAWLSMAGEAKRDYPASIGEQSPWWPQYRLVEDHFARLNTVLTRGRAVVRVGVIHPVESYWLAYGPLEHTAAERDDRERRFADLTEWLLHGLVDFDFVAESLLPELCPTGGAPLPVGHSRYDLIVLPGMRTIRSSTLGRLEAFRDGGGELIFLGEVPALVDALPSERALALGARSRRLEYARGPLLTTLEPWREVVARLADGRPADALMYQLREDGERRHLFVCNTDRFRGREGVRLAVRGEWRASVLDTLEGEARPLPVAAGGGRTVLEWDFPAHGHLLLTLEPDPGREAARPVPRPARRPWVEWGRLADPAPVSLHEPNVLPLDRAEYRLDDEPWAPEEEVLRLDTLLRRRLGWPLRADGLVQPWTEAARPAPPHRLSLRFVVLVGSAVERPALALENAAEVMILLDGEPVRTGVAGWWVDEAIQTVPLPPLLPGRHHLELSMPYGPRTDPEWCYLLGDFGVALTGRHALVTAPVRSLTFGDWTSQGLPFYAGNLTYHCSLRVPGEGRALRLEAWHFRAALLGVALDGRSLGRIAFAPFELDLGRLSGGHRLDITAYGSRVNAFGCLHNADEAAVWLGPGAWRTTAAAWTDGYRLRPAGVLSAPRLLAPPIEPP